MIYYERLGDRKFRKKIITCLKIHCINKTYCLFWHCYIMFSLQVKYLFSCITAQTKLWPIGFPLLCLNAHTVLHVYFPWKSPKFLNTCKVFSAPEVSKINIWKLYYVGFFTPWAQIICYVQPSQVITGMPIRACW